MPADFATELPTTRSMTTTQPIAGGPAAAVTTAPSFSAMASATTTAAATQPAGPPVNLDRWWLALNDRNLDSLIDRGVAANLDLAIATRRVQEAREIEFAVSGAALPSAEAGAGGGFGSGTDSTKGRIPGPLNAGTNTSGLKQISTVAGFDAAWEIDFFGRLRRQSEAAAADTQTALEFRNQVLITAVADVARAYVDARTLEMRLAINDENLRTEMQSVDLVQAAYDRGITNELDVTLARRELATIQSQTAPLQYGIAEARRRLTILLGQFPDDLAAELIRPAPLPLPPEQIKPGLPVDLLHRRPDIRQAERALAASTARIGVATANLFPRVVLTGGLGLQDQGLGRSPDVSSFIWSAGPAFNWPLLDFGTLDALVQNQDLRTQELLLSYRATVISAVAEVENAMTGYNAQRQSFAALTAAVEASQRALDLAQGRYDRGLTDFLNVLDAQRQLFQLQDRRAVVEAQVLTQYIALCKALGGGWEGFAPPPNPPTPRPAIIAAGSDLAAPHH
jgi:NodT family efflux transporter outer membrane factor (OMF) lipoprotein